MDARIPQTPEEQAKLRKSVIGIIRAVLIPEKQGLPLEKLNREYKGQEGQHIPWVRMGYRTLDDFVDQNPQLFRIQFKPDSSIWVHGVETEETKHVKRMVSQQRTKKRARPLPARRPFKTTRWNPPTPQMQFPGFRSGQAPPGRLGGSNRQLIGSNMGHVGGNRISGVQYNRRYPQSGGSGRFAGGSSGTNAPRKPEYVRSFAGQTQKLRIPNMPNNNQNDQQNVRAPKQPSGMLQQHMNIPSRRHINQMGNNANTINMNTVSFRPLNAMTGRQMNGNLGGAKSSTNANMNNINRNNNNDFGTSNNSKTNYEQYKPLLKEYFLKNNLGDPEYKTATLETKSTTGQNGSQGGKGFKSSRSMTRYMSTVKVKEKNYQTFPQDFATSEAAEEAAAKLACLQLNISKHSLIGDSSEKNSQHSSNQQLKDPSSGGAIKSQKMSTDTDFGDWIPPSVASEASIPIPSDGSNSNDLKKKIDRIVQLVGTRTNGVWSTQVDVEYSRTFKGEKLPERWPDAIEKNDYGRLKLRVDRPIPGRCIILPNLQNNPTQEATSVSAAGDSNKPTNRSESDLPVAVEAIKREKPQLGGNRPPLAVPTSLPNLQSTGVPPPTKTRPHIGNIPPPTVTSNVASAAIARRLNDSNIQIRPPSLQLPEEELWDVYITHVHSTMNVCLRLLGDEYSSRFDDLVTNMELHYFNTDNMPSVIKPIVGKLYAAKVDDEWHRVEVTNVRGIDISCYFIDHGDEEVLKAADLKEIDPEFLLLAPQAKHVRLAGLEDFQKNTEAIADLNNMALGRSLVGNVHLNDNDGVSLVLWDTSGDNEDININQTLLDRMKHHVLTGVESLSQTSSMPSLEELSHNGTNQVTTLVTKQPSAAGGGVTEVVANNSVRNLRIDTDQEKEIPEHQLKDLMAMDLSSFKPLMAAVLPDADDFFDVTVTLAGSPSNFTVQPYLEGKALEALQSQMNEFYSDENNHYSQGPLNASHLSKDLFFAGRHDDGTWYRVKVNSMLDEYSAAVKLVDYGDYSMMQLENMQPLWPHFRNLPMQAITASLAGIVATHGDWTPGDAVWFTTRVVNKQFVSKIKDVIWDMSDHDTCGNGFKLSLSLFDTSNPNEDVVIEKILVDAERAVYLCV